MEKLRTCAVSQLRYGVCFSFKKDGPIYVAGNRYIKPGPDWQYGYQMQFVFFGVDIKCKRIRYKLKNANKRYVYLHDKNGSFYSAIQPELTVKYEN